MKILSLCDGMSCGLIALKEMGIEVVYHAVEIDKHARLLSDSNFPDIVRWQNDVKAITEKEIIKNGPYDWVMFGSPCQSVSVAGKYCGDNSLAWINDKSGLLVDCLKILRWCQKQNPSVKYLIENVKMKKAFLEQFNLFIGHEPVLINSALVSAQNRNRYYWVPFNVSQPEDKGIVLKDIIDSGFTDREKAYCIDASYFKGGNTNTYFNKGRRQLVFTEAFGWSKSTRYKDQDNKIWSKPAPDRERYIEERINNSGKANTLLCGEGCGGQSTVNYVLNIPRGFNKGALTNKKTRSVSSSSWEQNNILVNIKTGVIRTRKLSVNECAKLQTIPEWYKFDAVSKTQAYKAIGNGWTVEVIKHILKQGEVT